MHMHAEGTPDVDPGRALLLSTAVEALRELIRADSAAESSP